MRKFTTAYVAGFVDYEESTRTELDTTSTLSNIQAAEQHDDFVVGGSVHRTHAGGRGLVCPGSQVIPLSAAESMDWIRLLTMHTSDGSLLGYIDGK